MEHTREGQSSLPDSDLRQAATVVLLRDTQSGPEVLLLERPSNRGSFAGAWVFPGGGVDEEDRTAAAVLAAALAFADGGSAPDAEERAARVAGVREVVEECGLQVPIGGLVPLSCWTPPTGIPKRMRTWFFVAEAPAGSIQLALDEVVDHRWVRPEQALREHSAGTLNLSPPTWVELAGLADYDSTDAALAAARVRGIRHFGTRMWRGESASEHMVLWQGDVAYDNFSLMDAEGPRHRLAIGALPWVYSTGDFGY